MNVIETKGKVNTTLDVCKAICSIIIASTHLPSFFVSEQATVYYNEWFFRFCVPFFFLCSGYFFAKARDKVRSLRRVAWLFGLAYILYLPAILAGVVDLPGTISVLRWNLVFGYEHLWYLNATLEGMLVWYLAEKISVVKDLFRKWGIPGCIALLLAGALLDEHYPLLNLPLLTAVGDILRNFGGPRNVVFMGFPLLVLGGGIARYEGKMRKIPAWALVVLWFAFRSLAWWECGYLLENRGIGITNDLTFFGCWPAVFLFLLSFRVRIPISESNSVLLRKLAEYVYILHPLMAAWISKYHALSPLLLWISTIALCAAIYILLEKQFVVKK